MQLEMQPNDGLQPERQKHNQDQSIPAKATLKPEVTITNPKILGQMPGPMPMSMAAADEVDKWVKTIAPGQNSLQPGMVELSTQHHHYYVDQIDLLRPTVYHGAAAIIFRYQDRTTSHVQVVIIKLDRRDHAIPLARAIAWRRIQLFPQGQFIQGTDSDLTDCPPFNAAQCVDNYFRQRWLANANAKLATDRAAVALPLEKVTRQVEALTQRITSEECQRNATFATLIETETKLKQEHDRAEFLNRMVYWLTGFFTIIIIIIFVVHRLWPQL
ncbi:MAG: hypothetical protein WCH99_09865 [Verrucomicrobiota bacterium]